MTKTILITGCSSGIGLASAVLLAKEGNKVYATMRNLESKNKLAEKLSEENAKAEILQMDVTDESSVQKCVEEVISKEGKIDVLINNAGYGLMGPAETVSMEQAKEVFEVNFFGLLRATQAVLPGMRKAKSGRIINISSIAGLRSMPMSDLYNSTKYAVEGLTEAMAPVMKLKGIKMILIEPGPVATDFNERSIKWGEKNIEEYENITKNIKETRVERFKNAQSAIEIAELISKAISSEEPDLRYQTSQWVKDYASEKYSDLDGNKIVQQGFDTLKNA